MLRNHNHTSTVDDVTPAIRPGNYSPVNVDIQETMGALFLGILACITLIGWMRAEARIRALMKQLQPA